MKINTEEQKGEETKNFNIKDIAKLVRKDLKETFGKDFKFSVTISHYSMGQSLNISILTSPRNYLNPIRVKDTNSDESIYIKEGFEVLDKVESIVNQFNYDNSDSMTNYFDVNFYSNIIFDYDLTNGWRAEIKEDLE